MAISWCLGVDLVQTQIRVAEGHSLPSLGLTQVPHRATYFKPVLRIRIRIRIRIFLASWIQIRIP
jgi:hypothetical protein